jgi:polyisoprenoid-binding protein YceI
MMAVLGSLLVAGTLAAQDWTVYKARPGSKVTVAGTSTIHDWTVETSLIGGTMELGPEFPLEASKNPKPGKVQAKAETVIFTSSIKSGKKSMDEVMYETMDQKKHPKITFKLQELSLKETPQAGSPLKFDAVGVLNVSGTLKTNAMEVTMMPSDGGDKILVKGETNLKMTDFGMKPPSPSISLGLVKTGDDVKVSFEWVTAKAE